MDVFFKDKALMINNNLDLCGSGNAVLMTFNL